MECRVEFFIQPFTEGNLGPHVREGIAAVTEHGLDVEIGPFGNQTEGSIETVAPALAAMLIRALSSGANRISITVVRAPS